MECAGNSIKIPNLCGNAVVLKKKSKTFKKCYFWALLGKKVASMGHAQNQSPILFTDIIHSLLLLPSLCRQTYTSDYSFGLGKNNYQNSRTP